MSCGKKVAVQAVLLFASVLLLGGCAAGQQTVPKEKRGQEANMDGAAFDRSDEEITYMDTTDNVIYLAGGCFWGMEQLMESIPGVIDAESGYANGTCEADADYQTVCRGNTGFRETVRVEYDPEQVSLDALLLAYFYVIDPTVENRQGNDIGSQYQTGVYYTSDSTRETVERIAEIERGRRERFSVEIGPLKNYYTAEAYHQNYLEKNPETICIVSGGQGYNEPCTEAQAMADYMEAAGIEKDRLILEDESKTTEQNIKYSKKYMKDGASVGIITNDFHMFRAMQITKGEGLKSAKAIAAGSNPLYLPNNMLREYLAEWKYLIRSIL